MSVGLSTTTNSLLSPSDPRLTIASSASSYTHLHVHSLYSDGLAHPQELARKAHLLGYSALALTDHNTLAGHPAFVLACHQYHIHPILGVEVKAYYHDQPGHVLVLSSSREEYDRLRALMRRKQKVRLEHLKGCGYITTACLGGHVAQELLNGDYFLARDTLADFHSLFGDRLFVEIQPTFGTILPWLLSLARDLAIPAIVTNDVHVVEPQYPSIGRLGLYLFGVDDMLRAAWYPGYREACHNAAELAAQCYWMKDVSM